MSKFYSVIIPVYNEELVIEECYRRLSGVMSQLDGNYELVFINDGSRDNSEDILLSLAESDRHVQYYAFSRNFGHQTAISAGFDNARGDAVIVIDADLQDPPEIIPEMIEKWKQGFDVVYGLRKKRVGESLFKKASSKLYYRFLNRLTDVPIPVDVGDFRLIDRKVCDVLKNLTEHQRYVRGIISWIGFKQTYVEFERDARLAGETKYPLNKMLKFAADGVLGFSEKPLKLALWTGVLVAFAGFAFFLYVLYLKFFTDKTELGWASLMVAVLFFNGYTLIMLGIIGEYLGRLYIESKNRPYYIIGLEVRQDPVAEKPSKPYPLGSSLE